MYEYRRADSYLVRAQYLLTMVHCRLNTPLFAVIVVYPFTDYRLATSIKKQTEQPPHGIICGYWRSATEDSSVLTMRNNNTDFSYFDDSSHISSIRKDILMTLSINKI